MATQPADTAFGRRGKCPVCGRPSVEAFRPFCSRRCADVDLARWLSGAYVIPDKAEAEADGAEKRSEPGLTGQPPGKPRQE
jgi:endogenous inhibitor of DNA gyrase (YacG/DUF329 family)